MPGVLLIEAMAQAAAVFASKSVNDENTNDENWWFNGATLWAPT